MATQQATSHHYTRHADGTATYAASIFRYIWPAECDLMAQLAVLLAKRFLTAIPQRDDHPSKWLVAGRSGGHVSH